MTKKTVILTWFDAVSKEGKVIEMLKSSFEEGESPGVQPETFRK